MKVESYNSLTSGSIVFCTYAVLRGIKSEPWHNGETYGYSGFYTTPDEYFADNPEASCCTLNRVEDGQLVHGCGTFNHSDLERADLATDYFLRAYATRIAAQRNEAERDGSMARARAKVAATAKAASLPVVTAATHEPVPGENFRRWSKRDLPAIVVAKRRAVELGCEAVILHTLPGEKYGMRWSPARAK